MWSSSLLFFLLILGPMFVPQSSAKDAPTFAASKANIVEDKSDLNVIAEKVVNRLVNALKRKDDHEIDLIIDESFKFEKCGKLVERRAWISELMKKLRKGV
ncbi:hypothetical protein CAEBREN_16392 [Caenorhabditis brenneri]|uniref:Uncharacterized protein n=1 Tax=Caenorhabditis brenneri TaxID=135651 RepID=G0P1M7_CAEBE|nr:hypothetical protein CAEBREN_16392 [Caenorhabditis brenneri]